VAFLISKSFSFEAAHRLPHHDGKCARLHGHSFRATIFLHSWQLEDEGPKSGMVVDFYDVAQLMKPLLDDYLDHHFLNDTLGLENPTSEEISRWLFFKLAQTSLHADLQAVSISETCTSRCTYTRGADSERGIERYK
jgi:6-pyruvoyltetrahydropterin/6-carboxytetrahydropterin synthase